MTAVGYAHVSTSEQNPALQHDALTGAGCAQVFTDIASGAKTHLFAALAEFERDLLRERTTAGLAAITARRARGRQGGRLRKMTPEKITIARQMHDAWTNTVAQVAQPLGVSRGTVYQHLDQNAAAR